MIALDYRGNSKGVFLYVIRFLLLLLVFTASGAHAQETEKHAQIRLLSSHSVIGPDQVLLVGIEQIIAEGWHTYWKYPGDSGEPMRVHWNLPEGFKAGPILWPVPHKIPYDPLLNYGYKNRAVFLQKISTPHTLPESPITLSADIELLVCEEICIPEEHSVSLTLNSSFPTTNGAQAIQIAKKALPQTATWPVTFFEEDNDLVLTIEKELPESAEFFPDEWGIILNAAPVRLSRDEDKTILRQERDTRPLDTLQKITGLIVYEENGRRHAYQITASPLGGEAGKMSEGQKNTDLQASSPPHPTLSPEERGLSLVGALFFALLGGLVLNLMPCVFPVLSMKVLSSVRLSEKHPGLAALHGLAYTGGILVSFGIVAGFLIALKAAGAQIGWGFQLQNPGLIVFLSYLLFILGLNLSGVFELGSNLGNIGSRLASKGGLPGSFFTGVLATLVATPCTAPFMGAAMGYALVQPALVALIIFLTLGLGLALPYLLLSVAPPLQKLLPKPGHWMETFRQFLAFPMFASAIWLVWVLSQQAGPHGVLLTLSGMLLIAFGFWLLRVAGGKKALIALALIAFAFSSSPITMVKTTAEPAEEASGDFYEPFSQARLETLLKGNDPVFVEMTAAWCITCKVNHKIALGTEHAKNLFRENGIRYLIGDWTNYDAEITKYLETYGRSGVPIYVFYGARDPVTKQRPEPVVLPQLLTPAIVADAVTEG